MHTHTLWAARVAAGTVLPDKRLSARLACLLETFAERPNDAIPQAAGSWGQAKGIYRFLANPRVQPDALQQGLSSDTARQCWDQPTVLVVQDTTSLHLTGCHVLHRAVLQVRQIARICVESVSPAHAGGRVRAAL